MSAHNSHKSWPFVLKPGLCLPKSEMLLVKDFQVFNDKTETFPQPVPVGFYRSSMMNTSEGQETKWVFWGLQLRRDLNVAASEPSHPDNPWICLPPTQLHYPWWQWNIFTALEEVGPTCKLTRLPLKPWSLPSLMQIDLEVSTEAKPSWWLILQQGPFESFLPTHMYTNCCASRKNSEAWHLSANRGGFSLNRGFWC